MKKKIKNMSLSAYEVKNSYELDFPFMVLPTLQLLKIGDKHKPIEICDPNLVHESAHYFHYLLDESGSDFSNRWLSLFRFPRNIIPLPWTSRLLYELTHVLHPYANYDYDFDPLLEFIITLNRRSNKKSITTEESITLIKYYLTEIKNFKIFVVNLNDYLNSSSWLKNFGLLPMDFPNVEINVFLTPFTENPFFWNPKVNETNSKICEDVAVHTQYFYLLDKLPERLWLNNPWNINFEFLYHRMQKSSLIQDKLRMLVEYGFLRNETLELLN
ncbi:MAG: hypothetical protein QXE31_00235 [Candidatus Woesearchaeota archaeon]